MDIVQLIHSKGFNLFQKRFFYDGQPLLSLAILNNAQECVRFFFSIGETAAMKDGSGNTPLHLSANIGNLEIFLFLVSKGGSLQAKNGKGRTPMDVARENGHGFIVDYMKENFDSLKVN